LEIHGACHIGFTGTSGIADYGRQMDHSADSGQCGLHVRPVAHIAADKFKTRVRPHSKQRFAAVQKSV
jgi:hypothetical protein